MKFYIKVLIGHLSTVIVTSCLAFPRDLPEFPGTLPRVLCGPSVHPVQPGPGGECGWQILQLAGGRTHRYVRHRLPASSAAENHGQGHQT